ncbi:methylamine utilization MauE [Solidesulfovibrio carbinoliphilus subsp. oakridgensis]|uniref:Methylamine utilization MauE n=1 Tax=Solidesulfovibrio carbinoliphilus subsp. oakridgensis TaxID=694327 RepID=G7Q4Q3_9BACT|nr:MauE/DoxX family redox-associated membrane protein [Solidesulfovibrio carbinoliphilus]EHJ47513.1 methylamine utilization MauE [Solidesulfovibrio carbinoliphilus subsp. oakridgensis]
MPKIATLLASAWPCRAVRLVLAVAFLAAGAVKLADVHAFVLTIKAFALLPTDAVKPVAVLLPILEILAGGLVLVRPRTGLLLVGGLLLLFIGVAGNALRQGLAIDCGCYGPGDPEGEVYHGLWPTVWRDCAMLAGVVYCLARRRPPPGPIPAP